MYDRVDKIVGGILRTVYQGDLIKQKVQVLTWRFLRLQFSSPRYLAGPYACTEVIQLRVTFFATWYKLYRYQGKETTQVFNTKKYDVAMAQRGFL